jgi:energy-coupling factor transport system ATP-binding protein
VAYERDPVVQGVDFALYPGEVTALMGRNGAGKSTLLKALVGLARPHQGRIFLRDCGSEDAPGALHDGDGDGEAPAWRDTAGMAVAEICRRIAYLPQDPNALLFADSVRDELRVTLRNHDIALEKAPVAPERLLDRLGLQALADAYPRDLSVGERQRVALGAMLVTAPSVILLDEPTRGLDYVAKMQLLALIRSWRDEGRAVLLVTHDVELAAAAADRVVLMRDGRIAAQGAPADVLGRHRLFAPQIARLFPGTGWLTVDDALTHLDASR